MKKIGITGGIGSGKTLVCTIFTTLGIPVYSADIRAKQLIASIPALQKDIINYFGEESFTKQGYNTKYMASQVFTNKEKLRKINALIHPHVLSDFEKWVGGQEIKDYIVYEAAILFETGGEAKLDKVVVVDAPLELRIKRLMQRDGISLEEIEARMKNQWSADKKRAMADWIVENNDKQLLLPQVLAIHNEITKQ